MTEPQPGDPDFFTRFTLSDDILADAFGPAGGTEPPRVTRRPRPPDGDGADPGPDKA